MPRIVLITGANKGIGFATARLLGSRGMTVLIGSRDAGRGQAAVGSLREAGIDARAVTLDVTDEASIENAASWVAAEFGHLDVLVNNAGIGTPVRAEDEPIDEWRRVVDVNLTGLFLLCQLAGRQMIAQGSGSIINIASILGLVASAPINQASYTATKGAVVNLTRELGCQWARKGVRVNAIAPGWFPTEMTGDKMFGDPKAMDYLRRNCPMGRGGEQHELDGVLLFLATDASSYVTGVTIPVDGGWTAR